MSEKEKVYYFSKKHDYGVVRLNSLPKGFGVVARYQDKNFKRDSIIVLDQDLTEELAYRVKEYFDIKFSEDKKGK